MRPDSDNTIFISSFSREDPSAPDEKDPLWRLRERLWNMDRKRVWVAEYSRPDLAEMARTDPIAVADILVDRVKRSRCVVVILGGARLDHLQTGMPLVMGGEECVTSHFEIELLSAAIAGKPIHLFKFSGFRPGPRLAALLQCLEEAYPDWNSREVHSGDHIEKAVGRLLRDGEEAPAKPAGDKVKQMIRGYFRERGAGAIRGGPEVMFLNGKMETRGGEVNEAQVWRALDGGTGFSAGSVPGSGLDMQQSLSRAWMALRELMGASFDPAHEHYRPELLPLWERAFSHWSGAAAWSSLHGHLHLGTMATLAALDRVRSAARRERRVRLEMETASLLAPHGGYASAWYSIAQRLPLARARRVYRHALRYTHMGMLDLPNDSGLHALRGSIRFRLGNPWGAVSDYERAWRLLPRGHTECPETGQIMVELAFGRMFCGDLRGAKELARRGVERMRLLNTEDGFLLRALRKYSLILRANGEMEDARDVKAEIRAGVERTRIFDQNRNV